MSQLLIVGFKEKYKADEVMLELLTKERQYQFDLEDAIVVTKNFQEQLRVKSYYDLLPATEGQKSESLGFINSTLFESSDQEALAKIGLNQQIIAEIRELMKPNSSIIIVVLINLINKVNLEQIMAEIQKYQGKVLYTTLTFDSGKELFTALS